MTRTAARRLALGFAAGHVAVCAAGLVTPAAYGLGIAADPRTHRRLRLIAALDLPFAGSVGAAVLRDRPARRALQVGAGSDLTRAALLLTAFRGRAPRSRAALVAASVAGAATASVLAGRVDR